MSITKPFIRISFSMLAIACTIISFSCKKDDDDQNDPVASSAVLLVIDESSIDNGNLPNNFSETDVNDQLAIIGLRQHLKYFKDNVGKTIDLYTGEVGDEGWFAIKSIPSSWKTAGPSATGARNFLSPGPGLGASGSGIDQEAYLDNIPEVTPLRATALSMLTNQTVLAVVYDSGINTNYSPLRGSLKGENLGLVAFKVLSVAKRTDGSSASLPKVSIQILNVSEVSKLGLSLFSNAPAPTSSSEPMDITPPSTIPGFTAATAP
jgi:hypothetical protein